MATAHGSLRGHVLNATGVAVVTNLWARPMLCRQGLLPPSLDFDLLRGAAPAKKKEDERPATKKAGVIRFGSNAHADAAVFTPDGQHLITGTVDGFVEVWNYDTCKVNTDLPYQAKDKFMMHDDAVQCMAVSTDSELLATGARNGKIKVWRLASGKCVRKFPRAHEEGVGSVEFNLDSTQLLSGSSDMTARYVCVARRVGAVALWRLIAPFSLCRVHGLLSGKLLKEFRGHTSYVNTAVYNATGHRVLTGSSDGTMKVCGCVCVCVSVWLWRWACVSRHAYPLTFAGTPSACSYGTSNPLIVCVRSGCPKNYPAWRCRCCTAWPCRSARIASWCATSRRLSSSSPARAPCCASWNHTSPPREAISSPASRLQRCAPPAFPRVAFDREVTSVCV